MFKCEVCRANMVITEIDKTEGIAWVCCPGYLQGNDKHESYKVKLTEKIEELFLQQG